MNSTALLCAGLLLAVGAQATPAVQQLADFGAALAADKGRGDWSAYLDEAARQREFLNGSPASHLEVARAQLQLDRPQEALVEARRFLAMGRSNPILGSDLFRPLSAALQPLISRNRTAICGVERDVEVGAAGDVLEDLDYDRRSQRFFVTSILGAEISTLDREGTQQVFARSPDHWPMVAIKIDQRRRILWATEAAFDGFTSIAPADWGRSAVLEYDLDRAQLRSRVEGPPHGNLGDLALAANGDPLVSDGEGGGIYRLQDGKLTRIDHGDFISPQTIASCGDEDIVFVPDYVRGIGMLNLKTAAVRWLPMQNRYALDGIDGLYCRSGTLTAIQNSSAPQRVVKFALNRAHTGIVGQQVVARAEDGDFTHGVFVDRRFYYLDRAGWNAVDEHGERTPSVKARKARIVLLGGSGG